MSRLDKAFRTSEKLEKEGVIRDFGYCRITLARAGGTNRAYAVAMEKIQRKYEKLINAKMLSDAKSAEILAEVYADTIVLNWETNTDEAIEDKPENWKQGIEFEEIEPFNRENVIAAFKRWPELLVECKSTAEDMQFYLAALVENTTKN